MTFWRALLLEMSLLKSRLPLDIATEIKADRASDWFRLETIDDSLQPTIDMLLNLAMFMWFGAVCPWSSFLNNNVIPIYRLIFLGILILLVRRLPIVLAMHKYISQIENFSQAAFAGFFGPIGVGAIFYLSISLEFLHEIKVDGQVREDVQQVIEAIEVVVWFLVVCSIVSFPSRIFLIHSLTDLTQVVHGLSVPVGKAGYHLPRTISSVISTGTVDEPDPIPISNIRHTHSTATPLTDTVLDQQSRKRNLRDTHLPLFRIDRPVVRSRSPLNQTPGVGQTDEPERPVNLIAHDKSTGAERHAS